MKVAKIIGVNITKLMEETNITAVELSKKVGVTRQTFSNYLNGDTIIDSEKLKLLSEFFGKSLDYFFEQNKLHLMLRAINPKKNIENNSILEVYNYIEEYYKLIKQTQEPIIFTPTQYDLSIEQDSKNISIEDPILDFKRLNYKIPKELENVIEGIAYEQRKKLGIETTVSSDIIIQAIENTGIKILFKTFDNLKLFGASAFSIDKGFFILINDSPNITEERKVFSLIHEYAHIILHRYCYMSENSFVDYGDKKNIFEVTADSFAGYFLIPKYMLKKYDELLTRRPLLLAELITLKQRFSVSLMAFTMNIYKYGYINSVTKKRIFDILTEEGFSIKEPNSILSFKKNKEYNLKVKSSYLNKKIDIHQLAKLLSTDLKTVLDITQEWELEKIDVFLWLT